MVFCDWITLVIDKYVGIDIDDGFFVELSRDGSEKYRIQKRLSFEGSWSEKITVRAWKNRFEISGNPTKFLQGHNFFGTNDIRNLLSLYIRKVVNILNIDGVDLIDAVDTGNCRVTRIDLTDMYDVGKYNNDVISWIRSAAPLLVKTRQNISFDDGTLYVGKHSRRISCKIYNKLVESKVHCLPFSNDINMALSNWVKNKLRLEFVCRRQWLLEKICINGKVNSIFDNKFKKYCLAREKSLGFDSKSLSILKNWSGEIMSIVFLDLYEKKIKLPKDSGRVRVDLDCVPRYLRATLFMWQNGLDVKFELPPNTYYRHRRKIKELIDLDIASNFEGFENTRTVVPLVRPLMANSASVPSWAADLNLVA